MSRRTCEKALESGKHLARFTWFITSAPGSLALAHALIGFEGGTALFQSYAGGCSRLSRVWDYFSFGTAVL